MRQSEVPSCADLLLKEIDAVDGEEVGVEVVLVVEDPQEFVDPFTDGLGPVELLECVVQQPEPSGTYLAFPSRFSCRPKARSRTLLTIHSICSSVSARDCSSAM